MAAPLSVPLILGTPRAERRSEAVARFVYAEMEGRGDMSPVWFDVRDFSFPHDRYGQQQKDMFPEWRDAVVAADGIVIVAPEYNHGYPGTLKSALDLLLAEYRYKAAGIVGVSNGSWGGTRMIMALLPVLSELGLMTISRDLHFPNAGDAFDEQGNPVHREADTERAKKFLDEFSHVAYALRTLRV